MKNEFMFEPEKIIAKAKKIRQRIIKMNSNAGQGHTGADLSETDILASLFFRILKFDKNNLDDLSRDRFILSKGHGVGGFYCTLAEAGLLDKSLLQTFLRFNSNLPGHPVKQKNKFVELNTGALGHGLPVGVGLALSSKLSKRQNRIFVLTGDGELQEGSNWEAMMSAAHYKLDNLIFIIDRNKLQLANKTEIIMALEPLEEKLKSFGFKVYSINGNNPYEIIKTIEEINIKSGRPHAVIANTIKGKGVSFIEGRAEWHHKIPVGEQVEKAIKELE
ncbi:MAG: transketolase [Chitinispirillia bacterium]|jgi:transketolase